MEEKTLLVGTLCFLKRTVNGGQILLPRKTRKIGAGCRNGYGGGPENGETVIQAASRETREESGGVDILLSRMEKIAVVDFHNTRSDGVQFTCRVHSFIVPEWKGEPLSTDEMEDPRWYDVSRLPFNEMMPADRLWLPPALDGQKVYAEVWYGPYQRELLQPVEVSIIPNWTHVPSG